MFTIISNILVAKDQNSCNDVQGVKSFKILKKHNTNTFLDL